MNSKNGEIRMQVSYTEDGYLKVNVEKNGEIDYEQIQKMNTTSYLIPSLRDRYEENSILYYKGEHITVADFVKGKVFSFSEFQNLLVSLLEVYATLSKDGYVFSNTCVSLDKVFIQPVKKNICLVYVPVKGEIISEKERLSELLDALISEIQTNHAAVLLGMLLEALNNNNISLDKLIADIKNAKEQNLDIQSKVIEKMVEVPVEKIVIKDEKFKIFGVISIVVEGITGILLPIIIGLLTGNTMVNVRLCVVLSSVTIISYTISMMALNQKKTQNVTGNTMINVQETINGNQANQSRVAEKQILEKQKIQEVSKIKLKNEREFENDPARVKRNVGMQSIQENRIPSQWGKNSQNEMEKVRNSSKLLVSNNRVNIQDEKLDFMQEEGTAILYDDAFFNKAFIIENEKNGLMDRIFIDKTEFFIGRESGVDFRISDNSVSKKHAKINVFEGSYYISDLQSSNGTFVNGKRINEKYKLEEENEIKIGNKVFVFHNN